MKGSPGHGRPASAVRPPLIAVALLLATVPGCAGGAPTPPPDRDRTPANSPPPSGDPVGVCTELISYWAREALDGSPWAGLDWEQKGLSNEQLALHDEVLAAARAEQRRRGTAAAKELIRRDSARRCAEARGATGSSENWRTPDK